MNYFEICDLRKSIFEDNAKIEAKNYKEAAKIYLKNEFAKFSLKPCNYGELVLTKLFFIEDKFYRVFGSKTIVYKILLT